MSKNLKFLTLLVLLALVLVGCNGANDQNANNDTGNNDAPTEPPATEPPATEPPATEAPPPEPQAVGVLLADLDGVEVEFWHVWDRDTGDALIAIVDEFNATNEYGITVVQYDQGSYGDVVGLVEASITTGEFPDVTVGYRSDYLGWESAADVVADLTPYVDDPLVGYSADEIAEFTEVFWMQDVVGDARYGLPFSRSAQFLYYNTSYAQDLGFDAPPSTPAEFKEQACAATADNGLGGWFTHTGADTIASWIFAFGGEYETEDGYTLDTPEALAAFEFLADLGASGCAWRPENSYPNAEFATRQGLFYTSSSGGVGYQEAAFEDAGSTDEWTLIPYPTVDGGGVLVAYGPTFIMIEGTPEEMLATWIFMKFVAEPENQVSWVEASGYYPPRESVVDLLGEYISTHPFFGVGYDAVVSSARFTSMFESGAAVRSLIQDAAALLFQDGFDPTTIPQILADLQAAADEAHAETGGN